MSTTKHVGVATYINGQRITVRSRNTCKYHIGWAGSNATLCNHSGNVRMTSMIVPQQSEVEKAPKSAFCKKCFPEI